METNSIEQKISKLQKDNTGLFVYSFGKNSHGELALGHSKAVNQPFAVKQLRNQIIDQIFPGSQHTALITQQGVLMVVGSNLHNKLGIPDMTFQFISKFQNVQAIQDTGLRVKQAYCGEYHTLCLLEDGQIYTWGGTLHKKLGQTSTQPAVIKSLSQINIIQIGCGDFHSIALSDNGELYSWGGGGVSYNKGQLGHGHLKDVDFPEKIKFFQGKIINSFACGGYHVMALTNDNVLYGWGRGDYGACGIGEYVDQLLPRKANISYNQKNILPENDYFFGDPSLLPVIRSIKCGIHHTLILTNKGHVYSCGYGQYGQLGHKNTQNQNEFINVYALTNQQHKNWLHISKNLNKQLFITQIAAGSHHSFVLTKEKIVYSCGYGKSGQLGLGNSESKTSFNLVESLACFNISKIFAGGNHSWVVLDHENPVNYEYSPPQPLLEYNAQNTSHLFDGQSDKATPMKMQFSSDTKDMLQNLNLSDEFGVQICFTDVEMCHRFIRVFVQSKQEDHLKDQFDSYFKELCIQESGVVFHNVVKDEIVTVISSSPVSQSKANLEDKQISIQAIEKNQQDMQTSYTIMVICDVTKNKGNSQIIPSQLKTNNQFKHLLCKNSIGEVMFLKKSEIQKDETQSKFANWISLFEKTFQTSVNAIRYFELRPLIFM